jgi:hypothetical protein
MLLTKLKVTLAVCLAIGLLGMGTAALGGWLTQSDYQEQAAGTEPPAVPQGPGPDGGMAEEPEDPAKLAASRALSQRNLNQIGIALHNYHDTYRHFPPPAQYGNHGKPLLSWRVAILPFVEQENLYKRFKLEEPWDSPNNKALLSEMPSIYAPVGGAAREPGMTYYQAIVGPGAAFERQRKLRLADITDGTANTIFVVEAAAPVPWTKPEDLPFVADQALPKFGGLFQGDFHALFGDGSVRLLSRKVNAEDVRKALTRTGGEVIDEGKLSARAGGVDQLEGNRLAAENAGLKLALQTAAQEIAQLKKEVEAFKA